MKKNLNMLKSWLILVNPYDHDITIKYINAILHEEKFNEEMIDNVFTLDKFVNLFFNGCVKIYDEIYCYDDIEFEKIEKFDITTFMGLYGMLYDKFKLHVDTIRNKIIDKETQNKVEYYELPYYNKSIQSQPQFIRFKPSRSRKFFFSS